MIIGYYSGKLLYPLLYMVLQSEWRGPLKEPGVLCNRRTPAVGKGGGATIPIALPHPAKLGLAVVSSGQPCCSSLWCNFFVCYFKIIFNDARIHIKFIILAIFNCVIQ